MSFFLFPDVQFLPIVEFITFELVARCYRMKFISHTAAIASSAHVIHGEISCGSQFHFSMETQVCGGQCTPNFIQLLHCACLCRMPDSGISFLGDFLSLLSFRPPSASLKTMATRSIPPPSGLLSLRQL